MAIKLLRTSVWLVITVLGGAAWVDADEAVGVREWTSADGGFKVRATLTTVIGDIARLKKENGAVIDVSRDKLSATDQQFIDLWKMERLKAARRPPIKAKPDNSAVEDVPPPPRQPNLPDLGIRIPNPPSPRQPLDPNLGRPEDFPILPGDPRIPGPNLPRPGVEGKDANLPEVNPYSAQLRTQVNEWLAVKSKYGNTGDVADGIHNYVRTALQQGKNFSVTIGSDLTKSGRSALLMSHGKGLFVFDLSPAQLLKLGGAASATTYRLLSPTRDVGEVAPTEPQKLPFKLSTVTIGDGSSVNGRAPLQGRLRCEGDPVLTDLSDSLVIRVSFHKPGSSSSSYSPLKKEALGKEMAFSAMQINFQMFAIPGQDVEPDYVGPLVLFVDICQTKNDTMIPLSNVVAALIDVR